MKKPGRKMNYGQGKNNVFEALVSVSLLIIFILVIVTGFLSHKRLNLIIDSVKSGIRPDRKLILVKEITNNLSEAENSVKSFSLTRNGEYLVRFYELTDLTGQQFEELDEMVSHDNPLVPYIDTLNQLVGEKFTILDRLLSIQDEFRVQQAMQQVVQSVREQEKIQTDTVSIPASGHVVEDTAITEKQAKKENFFTRLFRKKNKQARDTIDTSILVPVGETVPSPNQAKRDQDMAPISKKVEKVQDEVLLRDRRLREEEWQLLQQDKDIMKKIRQLIAFMEEKEKANQLIVTKEAELKANEVKGIIIAFGVAASFFILLAALVIYRYIRRNNDYKAMLVQAKKEAEALAKAKELFLANMSHEIRTPMNVISGFLGQVIKGPLDDKQREQLMIINRSSDHLLQLLNDLLDLSKIQADRLELVEKNFSPAEVIEDIRLFFEPAAEARNLWFETSVDPGLPAHVYGDSVRLRQILFNLTGNAIKFTEKGSVSLRSLIVEKNEDKSLLAFEVADTGIGMNEQQLGKIFGEFEKASTPGSNTEGAGLGLSITHKLVNLLGGNITVESQPGKGSTFRVELPYRAAKQDVQADESKEITAKRHLNNLQVMVVDDDEYNRRLARIILEKYGCRVTESGNAEEAIGIIEKSGTDLVLMDIHLPGMKGHEAAGKIKEISKNTGRNIPVIAVSASISKGDLENYRLKGLDDFLLKPYKEEALIEIINKLAGNDSVPLYDLGLLRASSGGSEEFVRDMVRLFVKDTDDGLTKLQLLIEGNNWQDAPSLAHKLISPCRHLKASGLAALLKKIENMENDLEMRPEAPEIAKKARIEFDLIRSSLIAQNEFKNP